MDRIAPAGDVYQAGTLSGNPLADGGGPGHAGLARRRRLRALDAHHRRSWPRGLREAAGDAGIPCRWSASPGCSPSSSAPRRCATTPALAPATPDAHAAWCRALLARGVYLPPSQFEAWFPSLAHGRRAPRAHARGGDGRFRRAGMSERLHSELRGHEDSLLRESVVVPADPGLGPGPGGGRRPARRRPARRVRLLVELIREGYRCTTAAPARCVQPDDVDLRCCRATSCTRWGWRAWPSWATWKRWRSWPT